MATSNNGPGVDSRHRGYNLRSGRRIQYDSPLVSRIPRSPACDESKTGGIIYAPVGVFSMTARWSAGFLVALHVTKVTSTERNWNTHLATTEGI